MKRLLAVAVGILLISAISSAQLAFKGVGGGVGYASFSWNAGTSTETMSGFLIAAHADLGEFTKDFSLVPDISYATTSKSVNGGTWKLSDFAINANVHYNIAMEGAVKPYVGAGLGFNSFSTTAEATYNFGPFGGVQTYSASASASRIGINLLAGINYPLNEMLTLVVEPRYTIVSDFGNFQVKVGVTYALK